MLKMQKKKKTESPPTSRNTGNAYMQTTYIHTYSNLWMV